MTHKITFKISEVLKVERTCGDEEETCCIVNDMKGGDIDIRHFTKDPESNTWTFSIYKLEVVEN